MKSILTSLIFVLFGFSSLAQDPGILKAGFAKIDITPSQPVMLYGYASRKTPSEGVHDPLSARIVVFENNGKKLLFVSSDLGSFPADVLPSVRKRIMEKFGLNESEIFLSTIHSHSSPILTLNKETGFPANIAYTEWLSEKLTEVADAAIKNLAPVTAGCGVGYSPVGSNRRETRSDGTVILGRNPYGITDKEVLVMKVVSVEGKALGTLYDYATHSTSLGAANLKVSGDVLGLSAQFAEKILGSGIVTPVFAGASGDIDPWYRILPKFNEEPGWIPEPVLLGTLLGEEVVTVYRGIKETKPGGEITSMSKTIECPARKTSGNVTSGPERQPDTVPVTITAARIGDVAFIGFNVEMLTSLGMKIKSASPFRHTFVITHCNGYSGYLAPLDLYKEGGYEVTSSKFEPGSAELIVQEAVKMLHDL